MADSSTQAQVDPASQEDEGDVALLIAGILAGTIDVPNPTTAIALALLSLIPHSVPHELAGHISADTARLVVTRPPAVVRAGEAKIRTSHDNLTYRALYGVQAIKRIVTAAVTPGEESIQERVARAFKDESRYFQQHREAVDSRSDKAHQIDIMAERCGGRPGWHSVRDEHTDAKCRELHGTNFDITDPPDGLYPGMRDGGNCRCKAGPPF